MVTDRVRLVLHLAFTFHRVNMVNSRHILAFFCFVGLQWLPVGQNEANAETIERIAAIAGDDIITLNDVRNDGVMRYLVKGKDLHDIDDSPKRSEELEEIVKELVQAKLIARQAKKNNIYVGDREVDAQLKEMFSRAGQSEESFKAMMAQEGIDWQAYRAYLRSEIEAQFVIRSELAGQVAPPKPMSSHVHKNSHLTPKTASRLHCDKSSFPRSMPTAKPDSPRPWRARSTASGGIASIRR